jgi:histidine ammonia-lyase
MGRQPASLEKIKRCRAMVEEKVQAHEIMYGVNTGLIFTMF